MIEFEFSEGFWIYIQDKMAFAVNPRFKDSLVLEQRGELLNSIGMGHWFDEPG